MRRSVIVPPFPVPPRLPSWAAGAAPAVRAGAALARLDGLVDAADALPWGGAWADRLAVAAAARVLARTGRPEDETAVRDLTAFDLSHGADTAPAGPAAPVVRAWRGLAQQGATVLRPSTAPGRLVAMGVRAAGDAEAFSGALRAAAALSCPLAALAAAVRAAARPNGPAPALLWAADAVLACRLGWSRGLPLVTLGLPLRDLNADIGEERLAAAVARGAGIAVDRFVDLGRRAAVLLTAQPQLRAKAAGRVIDRLLNRDALSVAGVGDLIPDRAARRLFDRLVELGAVRELTGRATARLYGL